MSAADLLGFLVAVALLAMVPGPASVLVIRRSALHGAGAALPVVAGIELGIFTWAAVSAFGVAALVTASETAYIVLKVVGACVLVGLGAHAWVTSRRLDAHLPEPPARRHHWRGFGLGAVTNLANPKAAVFAFAFYPQFVPASADVVRTTLLLALLQVVVDGTWYVLLAGAVGRARAFFTRAAVRRRLERLTGTVLIALGVRLAADHP
ncbi:MAG: LysE family translocator [Actinomycetes bacterium]